MKKQFWIVGDFDELTKNLPGEPQSESARRSEMIYGVSPSFEYKFRTFPDGQQFAVETNTLTGRRLLLVPIDQKFGKGILQPEFSDILLDVLLEEQIKRQGQFPVKTIELVETI
jgi:hypothetical protein